MSRIGTCQLANSEKKTLAPVTFAPRFLQDLAEPHCTAEAKLKYSP